MFLHSNYLQEQGTAARRITNKKSGNRNFALKICCPTLIFNMYFKRLRDLREDHDMKQSEVAEYLGIQQTVYSRYERGFQSIPVEHLIKLADLYKVSTDYILANHAVF